MKSSHEGNASTALLRDMDVGSRRETNARAFFMSPSAKRERRASDNGQWGATSLTITIHTAF